MRQSGIEVIGAIPWGTHFCQFYTTKQDLIDILVPYFREGLLGNEYCMWVTSAPLKVREAKRALKEVVPDLDARIRAGQIEILDYTDWYTKGGSFDADRVLSGWIERLEAARSKGFEGLRLTGNTFWLESPDWRDFTRYEETVNRVIGEHRMIAICTYSLAKCGAKEIVDVIDYHQFALIKREGGWEILKRAGSAGVQATLDETRQENRFLSGLIERSTQPFGVRYTDGGLVFANPAFEQLVGYTYDELFSMDVAKTLTPPEWREKDRALLGELERTGRPVRYEKEYRRKDGTLVPVELYVQLAHDAQGKPLFYSITTDITERRQGREALLKKNEDLNELNEELAAVGEELRRSNEALQKKNEELGELNEELAAIEEEIRQSNEELVRAHDLLKESESVHRSFFESPGLMRGIVEIEDNDILHVSDNSETARFYGRSPVELAGVCESELGVAPETIALWIARYEESKGKGGPVRFVYENGEGRRRRWFEPIVSYIGQSKAGRDRFSFVMPEVTKRKRAELELLKKNEELAAIEEELRQSNEELLKKNEELGGMNEELTAIGEELRQSNETLDVRVRERTRDLDEANRFLTAEVEERKRAEETIAAERKRLFDVLEMLPAYVCLLDPDYRMPFANRFFRERFGEPRGRPCYEFLFDRTEPCENCETYTVAKTRAPHHWEWTGPDGRNYDIHDFPFTDTDGTPLIMEMGIDITERKKAEEALREARDALEVTVQERTSELARRNEDLTATQEELLQNYEELAKAERDLRETTLYLENLIDHANAPIIVWDSQFRITRFNRAFERLTGMPAGNVLGKQLDILLSPLTSGESMDLIRKTTTGEPWETVEIPIRTAGGETRTVLWNSATIGEADGTTATSVIAQGQDITGRKAAETALQQTNENLTAMNEELTATQEELLQNYEELAKTERELRETTQYLENLISYANAPIVVWDPAFRITRFNRAFEQMTGIPAQVVIGQSLDILFPVETRDLSMELIRRASSGEHWEVVKIPIVRTDGEVRTVLWNSASIYGPDGTTVVSTIAQGQDITEMRRAEDALREYARNLARSNEELEQFAYVASHDLREPLRMVTSFSQLLAKRYRGRLDPDADEFIGYIVEGGTRMDALIDDLLEFSRVTTKGRSFDQTDMNDLVDTAKKDLAIAIRESGATVGADPLPALAVDRLQIEQVFQNLVSNAIKFRRENYPPEVWIRAQEHGHEWLFSVSDNGIGIDPAYHEKIFEIFQRLHNRDTYPGTGIGLAICRRIVERHGGRIWVESAEGNGSTFYFTIPAVKKQP